MYPVLNLETLFGLVLEECTNIYRYIYTYIHTYRVNAYG
jgi:hypothetical protein